MGASASRIWQEICSLQSDDTRAHMIETVLSSPQYVALARQSGIYGEVLAWLSAYRRGVASPFPYRSVQPDRIQHDTPRWTPQTEDRPRWEQWQNQAAAAPRATFFQPAPAPPPTYTAATPAIAAAASGAIIVSPAAKALDYFQEALEMLGIREEEGLTHDRLKAAYKRAARAAHPDKGGTKEQFDELRRAYEYVGKILDRVNPRVSAAEKARMSAPVTMESAKAARGLPVVEDAPPVILSAKKLDMSTFNKLFEENRLPDPEREKGYGDWMKGQGGGDEPVMDSRLQGKFNLNTFEQVFREKALTQPKSEALMKRLEPDALIAPGGVELGASTDNFTAAFGSDTQFTDLKQAYTTGATMFQDVADVRVQERSARSVEDAQRIRAAEMARVDPTESARIAAAAAALEERERQRRLRLAQADVASEAWSDQMRRRLMVRNG